MDKVKTEVEVKEDLEKVFGKLDKEDGTVEYGKTLEFYDKDEKRVAGVVQGTAPGGIIFMKVWGRKRLVQITKDKLAKTGEAK